MNPATITTIMGTGIRAIIEGCGILPPTSQTRWLSRA